MYKMSKAPERIQAITGEAHIHDLCMTESNYNSKAAYHDSKLAGMLFAREISRRYANHLVHFTPAQFGKMLTQRLV